MGLAGGGYSPILQNKGINALLQTGQKDFDNVIPDILTGETKIRKAGVDIIVKDVTQLKLNGQARRLIVFMLQKLAPDLPHGQLTKEDIDKHKLFTFTLSDYAELNGLTDMKYVRQLAREGARTLHQISIYWKDRIHGKGKKVIEVERGASLLSYELMAEILPDGLISRGKVTLYLDELFLQLLAQSYIMPLPEGLFRVSQKDYPHAFNIGYKLALQQNMNVEKGYSGVVSIKSLVDFLPDLPPKDKVKHIDQQIKTPFEENLNAITEGAGDCPILKEWTYYTATGEGVTIDDVKGLTYDEWEKLMIHFTFLNYPSQEARLEKESGKIHKRQQRANKREALRQAAEQAVDQALKKQLPKTINTTARVLPDSTPDTYNLEAMRKERQTAAAQEHKDKP